LIERLHRGKKSTTIETVRKQIFPRKRKPCLPKSPQEWLEVITEAVRDATPRTKQLLKEQGVLLTPNTKKEVQAAQSLVHSVKAEQQSIAKSRSLVNMKTRLILARPVHKTANPIVKRLTGFQKSTIVKKCQLPWNRKIRKDKTSAAEEERVITFYQRPQNCTFLPLSKLINKDNEPVGFLTKPTQNLYKEYTEETGSTIGLTKFREFRPPHCRVVNTTFVQYCLCEICVNIEEKCQTLNTV
jgi:hypothetical protein